MFIYEPAIYRKYILLWELWFIYGAVIYKNKYCCGNSGSFSELLFTGYIFWFGNSGSFTEMVLTGKMCLCGKICSFT
jgi:hypothetical protein